MITEAQKAHFLCANELGLSIPCLEILWKWLWLESLIVTRVE